ncbi:RNA polymerase III subunit C [Phyllostomus discolor]|uniref:DNA-directed RNA polymerase III subunit RPC3 n=1 Tax=Phyllostomus discolor TaxID=89673 RepID=A0A834DCH4_9CHIR|nr:RNA polymerase III subunit C [Phyllostomus discolor]
MYIINLHKALGSLATASLESVVQERFGSRCARIFRLVLQKKHLEQKQVEDFAMIPAKEAKDMLYKMLSENFISLQVTNNVIIINQQSWTRVRETPEGST